MGVYKRKGDGSVFAGHAFARLYILGAWGALLMNESVEQHADVEDDDLDEEEVNEPGPDDTVIISEDFDSSDDVGETTAEVNVENLIAELEASGDHDCARKKEIRRRLEEMAEEKSFEDTYAIDLGEDK